MRALIFLGAGSLLVGCWPGSRVPRLEPVVNREQAVVKLGQAAVLAEIADDPEKIRTGLSGREKMADNEGMLFLFDSPVTPVFWMKGMKFPLDFIWIKNNQITDFHRRVPAPSPGAADDRLERIYPKGFVDAVLEVNAGFLNRYNLQVGDRVQIDYPR